MPPVLSVFHMMKPLYHNDQDPFTANNHNAIKIAAAILGVLCVSIAILMSVFMYRHYLRRQHLTLPVNHPRTRKRSTSSIAPLITAQVQQRVEEQNVNDIDQVNIEEPPSPVMQQGLLQKELVKNYGSTSHPHNNTFLKLPSHHS